jgi:hypothetical protein
MTASDVFAWTGIRIGIAILSCVMMSMPCVLDQMFDGGTGVRMSWTWFAPWAVIFLGICSFNIPVTDYRG